MVVFFVGASSMVMAEGGDGGEGKKSRMVNRICEASDLHRSCGKGKKKPPSSSEAPFVDWYIVLGVDESVGIDGIKRQYHKLALMVHPDKNKHSKAESAFKLVSQAYLCLSDSERRREFDSRRKAFSCSECRISSGGSSSSSKRSDPDLRRRIRDLRNKLREEAIIIDRCMNAYASLRRSESSDRRGRKLDLPVFNPSDYDYRCRGRTECRRSTIDYEKLEELRRCIGGSKNSSPVFRQQSRRNDSVFPLCSAQP